MQLLQYVREKSVPAPASDRLLKQAPEADRLKPSESVPTTLPLPQN